MDRIRRERERERERDRQTDRQTGRQTDRDRERDRQRQTDRQTGFLNSEITSLKVKVLCFSLFNAMPSSLYELGSFLVRGNDNLNI